LFKRLLNKGLLEKQKPRRRKKKFSKAKKALFYFTSGLSCVFIAYLTYVRIEPQISPLLSSHKSQKTNWKVSVRPKDHTLLSSKHRSIIDKNIKKHLMNGTRDELQSLSDSILSATEFDKVNIKRIKRDRIEIGVEIPQPVALIQADKLRFVSKNGAVFGSKDPNEKTGFVVISGIFKSYKGKYKLGKTNKLIISPKYQDYIEASLNLVNLSSKNQIPVKKIYHNDYRGLALGLGNEVFVSLGHGPYVKKLARLKTILEKASQRGDSIGRIELDFAGKAFIQKKTEKQEI
jgi:hypothetical protein